MRERWIARGGLNERGVDKRWMGEMREGWINHGWVK